MGRGSGAGTDRKTGKTVGEVSVTVAGLSSPEAGVQQTTSAKRSESKPDAIPPWWVAAGALRSWLWGCGWLWLAVWLCGCVVVWLCGCEKLWLCGCG